jgi:hypothetical protein
MKITLHTNESVINVLRRAGYGLLGQDQNTGEISFVKRAGSGDYPRFHAYVKKETGIITVNLHLDQKKPSYSGSHAHNAEYEGDILDEEAKRINLALQSLK